MLVSCCLILFSVFVFRVVVVVVEMIVWSVVVCVCCGLVILLLLSIGSLVRCNVMCLVLNVRLCGLLGFSVIRFIMGMWVMFVG